MRILTGLLAVVAIFSCLAGCSKRHAQHNDDYTSIVRNLESREGFLPLYVGGDNAVIYARFPKPDASGLSMRFIHANSLNAGLGSNPLGLDRGLTTNGRILAVRQIGKWVIIEAENTRFRASGDNPLEQESVEKSFAKSNLWSGTVVATAGNGDLLVEISDFLTQDWFDVSGRLEDRGAGTYVRNTDRSYGDYRSALTFPDNTEIDAAVTFVAKKPGREVAQTAADGHTFTLSVHHSFVRLPDNGYRPRRFDPRVGVIDVPYYDFAAPLDQPVLKRYARRFRLQRADLGSVSGRRSNPLCFMSIAVPPNLFGPL